MHGLSQADTLRMSMFRLSDSPRAIVHQGLATSAKNTTDGDKVLWDPLELLVLDVEAGGAESPRSRRAAEIKHGHHISLTLGVWQLRGACASRGRPSASSAASTASALSDAADQSTCRSQQLSSSDEHCEVDLAENEAIADDEGMDGRVEVVAAAECGPAGHAARHVENLNSARVSIPADVLVAHASFSRAMTGGCESMVSREFSTCSWDYDQHLASDFDDGQTGSSDSWFLKRWQEDALGAVVQCTGRVASDHCGASTPSRLDDEPGMSLTSSSSSSCTPSRRWADVDADEPLSDVSQVATAGSPTTQSGRSSRRWADDASDGEPISAPTSAWQCEHPVDAASPAAAALAGPSHRRRSAAETQAEFTSSAPVMPQGTFTLPAAAFSPFQGPAFAMYGWSMSSTAQHAPRRMQCWGQDEQAPTRQRPPARKATRAPDEQDLTLRSIMQLLDPVDAACIIQVRRIKHLGFGSARALRAHYASFGAVDRVLVSHSHSQARVRPASMGFVVMEDAAGAKAVLAAGAEQMVGGCPIRVGAFERSGIAEAGE